MLTTISLSLADIVDGTSSNTEGDKLFTALATAIHAGQVIRLSMKDATPMSTSFLNSSFGELIDTFSQEKVRAHVKLVNYVPSHAMRIKDYIDGFSLAQAS